MPRIRVPVASAICLALLAGCGGGGDDDDATSASSPLVDGREIEQAGATIIQQCTEKSLGVAGDSASSKISLAVDALIRNYNIDPDAELDVPGFKIATPQEALEASLEMLEYRRCSPNDAQRVHEALSAAPPGDASTDATAEEEPTPASDAETTTAEIPSKRDAANRVIAFQAALVADFDAAACDIATDELQERLAGGDMCKWSAEVRQKLGTSLPAVTAGGGSGRIDVILRNATRVELEAIDGVWHVSDIK